MSISFLEVILFKFRSYMWHRILREADYLDKIQLGFRPDFSKEKH